MGQTHKQILPWYVCIKVDSSGYYLKKYLYSYYTILCTLFCMYGIIIWFPIRYYNLLAILCTLFCDGVLWRLLLFHIFGCYTFDSLFTWRCVWKYLFAHPLLPLRYFPCPLSLERFSSCSFRWSELTNQIANTVNLTSHYLAIWMQCNEHTTTSKTDEEDKRVK